MIPIFRFRPSNDLTIEELKENYVWFSRPTGFKDKKDANIIAFAESNESVKDAFNRLFSDYKEFGEAMNLSGICCFTNALPDSDEWRHFPNSANGGIVIEYDKDKLENHFLVKYCSPFNSVEYLPDPLKLISSTPDGYDVLWEITEDYKCYKSIRGDILRDPKIMDQFMLKLLTRIDEKHRKQNESRVILVRTVPDKSPDLTGYKIPVPTDVIEKIYVHHETPESFKTKLKSVISSELLIFNKQ